MDGSDDRSELDSEDWEDESKEDAEVDQDEGIISAHDNVGEEIATRASDANVSQTGSPGGLTWTAIHLLGTEPSNLALKNL